MELVIQTEDFKVKVDTEIKDFKIGDIIACYVQEFPNFEDKEAPPHIPAYWYLREISSTIEAKLCSLVDKHYKVVEIYGEV